MNVKEIQQYLSAYRKESKESFIDNSTIPVKNSIKGAVSAVLNAAKTHPKTAIAAGATPLAVAAGVGIKKHLDNKAAEAAAAAERIKKMAFGAGAGAGAGAVGAGVTAVGLAYLLYRAMKKKNRA